MTRTVEVEDSDTVIVATLKRGKNYKHFSGGKYHTFKRGVPEEVSAELADELEELVDRVPDDDGEVIEKDYFLVDRDASPRVVAPEVRRMRTRTVQEEVVERSARVKPVLKKPPAPKAPAQGFGKRTTR